MNTFNKNSRIILEEINETFKNIDDDQVLHLKDMILDAEKVFFVGVGRVFLSLQSVAKRFAHLGIDVYLFGEITEPAIGENDLLIVGSGSGESMIPLGVAEKASQIGVSIAHIGSSLDSSMNKYSDHFVYVPVNNKLVSSGIVSKQPMTSLFEQVLLLLGDTISCMIIEEKNIIIEDLWQYHANLE